MSQPDGFAIIMVDHFYFHNLFAPPPQAPCSLKFLLGNFPQFVAINFPGTVPNQP